VDTLVGASPGHSWWNWCWSRMVGLVLVSSGGTRPGQCWWDYGPVSLGRAGPGHSWWDCFWSVLVELALVSPGGAGLDKSGLDWSWSVLVGLLTLVLDRLVLISPGGLDLLCRSLWDK
jgi:hypothetical protein